MPARADAWSLFCEWTQSDSLRKHVLGVEACMRSYARRWGEDEELWAVTGIVHDLDYERYPDLETGHPRHALEELRRLGYPDEVVDAVAGHATFLGVPRETDMAKALFAVDELSGFIAACALVRPTGIHGMTPKSVKKKLKQPSFAAAAISSCAFHCHEPWVRHQSWRPAKPVPAPRSHRCPQRDLNAR